MIIDDLLIAECKNYIYSRRQKIRWSLFDFEVEDGYWKRPTKHCQARPDQVSSLVSYAGQFFGGPVTARRSAVTQTP